MGVCRNESMIGVVTAAAAAIVVAVLLLLVVAVAAVAVAAVVVAVILAVSCRLVVPLLCLGVALVLLLMEGWRWRTVIPLQTCIQRRVAKD